MPNQTYGQIFTVQTPGQTEALFAKDVLQGSYLVVQNNTAYDCNLLIFKDPTMAGRPNELTLRAGGSVTYGGDLGGFAVYSVGVNNAATGIKPAGFGGGYTGAGAQNVAGTIGYIAVFAWDDAVPVDIPQSNFSQVSASLSGALPAGTNHIGSVGIDSMPGATGATSQAQTGAANVATTLTIAGQAGKSIYIWGIKAGYTGGTSSQNMTVQDGNTTVETITVVNALNDERSQPLKISAGNSVTITLPAGGASIIGALTARYEIR